MMQGWTQLFSEYITQLFSEYISLKFEKFYLCIYTNFGECFLEEDHLTPKFLKLKKLISINFLLRSIECN